VIIIVEKIKWIKQMASNKKTLTSHKANKGILHLQNTILHYNPSLKASNLEALCSLGQILLVGSTSAVT